MNRLTRGIGDSQSTGAIGTAERDSIKKVLITRPNQRLGNQLLMTPLVQEVSETFPGCRIDLFVKGGLAPILFTGYDNNIGRIIQLPNKHFSHLFRYLQSWTYLKRQRYDLVINVEKDSSSGMLSTRFAKSDLKFFGSDEEDLRQKYEDYNHVAKKPVYNFRSYLKDLGIPPTKKKVPPLDLRLSAPELAAGRKIIENLAQQKGKTIAIFTHATGDKCYSESWWEEFHGRLKAVFVGYNIIEILPVENISKIGFKEPSFYSKDVRKIGAVIANTDVFIGADSGIMHLASASKTPTVGLFSVTSSEKYEPYDNGSLSVNTTKLTTDEIIAEVQRILA